MHIHFLGEADDGRSISSHHARALAGLGVETSFSVGEVGASAPDCFPPSEDRSSCFENDSTPFEKDSSPSESGVTAAKGPLPSCEGLNWGTARLADLIHLVTRDLMSPRLLRDVLRLRSAGKPIVRVWTAEDVLWATWHAPARAVAHGLARTGVRQFCRAQSEADQLATLGLEAVLLPALSINVSVRSQPQPLPKQLTLLSFLPTRKREYHGGELIDSLVRWTPSARFLILTDGPQSSEAKNVEYLNCVEDVGRSIQRATAVIYARSDTSVSRLVIEALSHGRHVITNCDFPHALRAESIDDYVNALRALGREASFNLAGREYVGKMYDRKIAADAWLQALRAVLEEPDFGGGVRGGIARAANLVREPLADPVSLPDPETLPADAAAFRALLRDRARTASTHPNATLTA